MQLSHVTLFWLRLAGDMLLDLPLYIHKFRSPTARRKFCCLASACYLPALSSSTGLVPIATAPPLIGDCLPARSHTAVNGPPTTYFEVKPASNDRDAFHTILACEPSLRFRSQVQTSLSAEHGFVNVDPTSHL